MKKMILAVLALSAVLVSSCNKDGEGGSNATVKFRKANISGARMLALASGTGAATKAEGDITVGPKALYTVSETVLWWRSPIRLTWKGLVAMLDTLKNSGIHVESYSVSGEKIHLQLRMQQRNYLDSLKNLISHLEGFKIEDLS